MLWTILWLIPPFLFCVLEAKGIYNERVHGATDETLSEKMRDLFHTKTKTGRTVWAVVWGLFAMLFALHISGSGWIWW